MLCEIADNYFHTLNPLSERIAGDIDRIKAAYENLWKELSLPEQEQIINETIIHPQVLLKYSLTLRDIYGKSGCAFKSGGKMVIDEQTGTSWRDEHSAPFSWKSRSLMELCNASQCVPGLPPDESRPLIFHPKDTSGVENTDQHTDTTNNDGGASEAFTNFCAKLKFIPGKSSGYQVSHTFEDKGFLSKMKNNAVCKLQNTFKFMGGKVSGPCGCEGDMLVVQGGGAVIVPRAEKILVAKPTSPPPPPPPRVLLRRDYAETPLLESDTAMIDENISRTETISPIPEEENGCSAEEDVKQLETLAKASHVPKTGFDFLDDW